MAGARARPRLDDGGSGTLSFSVILHWTILDLLHRIDFNEKAGTGIRCIRDGAREPDCPEPEFGAGNFVTVTFRPNPEVREVSGDDRVIPQVIPQVTGQVAPETRLLQVLTGK